MKTPVIDSIHIASSDGTYSELEQIAGRPRPGEWTEINALLELLKTLTLDDKSTEKIMSQALLATAAEGRAAFREGFRVGVRLMLETLGTSEAPETGGGA